MNWMKRYTFLALNLIVLLFIVIGTAHSQVTISNKVTPSTFAIPLGTATTQNISYTFTTTPAADITVQSNQGTFFAGTTIIGIVNVPITDSIRSGKGRTSELLRIPVSVTKKAKILGATRLTYVRTFSDGTDSVQVKADITITTEAGANFRVERLHLYFDNMRGEITIKKNSPKLIAYADIRFTGSGLLEGFWEVDGRLLSHVKKHLFFGRTVTIKAPEVPPLPTFDPGSHRLRFVPTRPDKPIPLPVAIYFVKDDTFKPIAPARMVSPRPLPPIGYIPTRIQLGGKEDSNLCPNEFLEELDESPLFSACRKSTGYSTPPHFLTNVFFPRKNYLWIK